MKDFAGKIAFITGGASGAGLGQAKVFAKAGMKVAIADFRIDALHSAVSEIIDYAGCEVSDVLPLCFDLTDRVAYAKAADSVEKIFGGPPHLLIQTAGNNSFGPIEASKFDDFDWVMGLCLGHVINGLVIFVPRMLRAYGGTDGVPKEEFHVVATSSMGACQPGPITGPYSAAKAAVNNLMYSYAESLRIYGGGSTVLCPYNIRTNIYECEKYRPDDMKDSGYNISEGTIAHLKALHAIGIDPVELAEILKEAIETRRVLVLPFRTHDEGYVLLRESNLKVENYMLTEEERMKDVELPLREPTHTEDNFAVPEGGEPFARARADLDYIPDFRKPPKK